MHAWWQSYMPAQSLAVDISLAALLGDNIYNFGELLLHPIVRRPCLPVPAHAPELCSISPSLTQLARA